MMNEQSPLSRYAWKRQGYRWLPAESIGLPSWVCEGCGKRVSNKKRHDATCKYRERDTTRLKPAFAPDPWRK